MAKSVEKIEAAQRRQALRKKEAIAKQRAKAKYNSSLGLLFSDQRWLDLLDGEKFVLIDGGAQGGIEKEWQVVTPLLKVVAVEPRAGTFGEPLTKAAFETVLVNSALDGSIGTRDLHVVGSMSSFLAPDFDCWNRFGFHRKPPTKMPVATTTLDALVSEHALRFVDFIKLDTQGTELDILKGGPIAVGEMAAGLRVEMLFYPLYKDQALFADVDCYVRSQGFDLIDLTHFKRYVNRDVDEVDAATASLSPGQLLVTDGIYFRTPDFAVERLRTLPPESTVTRVRAEESHSRFSTAFTTSAKSSARSRSVSNAAACYPLSRSGDRSSDAAACSARLLRISVEGVAGRLSDASPLY